jgi:SAM-dependent methyltransferase
VGRVEWGDWRRVTPIDGGFGRGRGLPIDRFYVERFLRSHAAEVRGHVLLVRVEECSHRFGSERAVPTGGLDRPVTDPKVTQVGDVAAIGAMPADTFDCVVLVHVLHLAEDVPAVLAGVRRILNAGGVLLLSVPGTASPIAGSDAAAWHRGFTELSVRRLLGEGFEPDACTVRAHGNVLAGTALLQGLAAAELSEEELAFDDPKFPVVVVARARKASAGDPGLVAGSRPPGAPP